MLICSKEAANVALNEYWNTIDPNGSNVGQNVMPGGLRVYNSGQIEAMQRAVEAALRLIDDAGEPVSVPPVPPAPFLTGAALHQREMIEGGPRPLDRLAGQIAGLADTVIRAEGRLADRVADLARLVVDLAEAEAPTVELDTALAEPTEADLWARALGMAADQRDRKQFPGAFLLRQALWFHAWLQDGPEGARDYLLDDANDEDAPTPVQHPVEAVASRPHLYSATKDGDCRVVGCDRPLMDDVHKLPGNGYAGPNPITAPAG